MLDNIKMKPLKTAARIFSGASIYGTVRLEESEGGIPVINIKDINNGRIEYENLPLFDLNNFRNAGNYIVSPGDVILSCRGTQLKSAVVPKYKKFFITANLIAIRPGEEILPEFLATYFNTRQGQKAVLAKIPFTTVFNLTVNTLREIEIPVPPLSVQEKIVTLAKYAEEQYHLTLQIANLRKILANQLITNMFNNQS